MSVAQILTGDWPYSTEKCGMRMAQLIREGRVRHDIIIEKAKVGKNKVCKYKKARKAKNGKKARDAKCAIKKKSKESKP